MDLAKFAVTMAALPMITVNESLSIDEISQAILGLM